jgi:stage IV sporulation protein FB
VIIFHVGKSRVVLSFWFVAGVAVLLLTDWADTTLLGLLAALCHEGGHLLVLSLFHAMPEEVALQPFGVLMREKRGLAPSWVRDCLVSLGGPMMNLLFWAVLRGFWPELAAAQLVLGVFQLLPIVSLDGGRALESLLSRRFSGKELERLGMVISLLFLVPMAVMGFWLLLSSRYNFSLLLVSVYLMLCLVLRK